MTYGVVKIYISEDRYPDLYAWLDEMSHKAKCLKTLRCLLCATTLLPMVKTA